MQKTNNVIQKMRLKKNLSQSQLSKQSGVNLRTLQDFEQGRKPIKNAKGEMLYQLSNALECSIEELICEPLEQSINATNSAHLSHYYNFLASKPLYDKYYSFPIIVPDSKIDMHRVYPTKQKLVATLHKALCKDARIIAVMLFGSSISMQCNQNSDTDLSIRLDKNYINNDSKNSISEIVQEICDWKADIIWHDRISKTDRIYHDICKGVQIV